MSDDFSKFLAGYEDCKNERSEWEAEWRSVSEFLLPGRGIYQTLSKPRKRKLTAPKVVNNIAEEALYVLTSGMHGGLTSPSMPWFSLTWADKRLLQVEPLKQWLEECERLMHAALHNSEFYSKINSFYTELCGFGTGCLYVGEDTDDEFTAFRFELLTAGEYAFTLDSKGQVATFYRTIFKTPAQVVEMFPKTASAELKRIVTERRSGMHRADCVLLEVVYKQKYQDKKYTRKIYELSSVGGLQSTHSRSYNQQPLSVEGFYEFPYKAARWDTIGSDVYGIGPGSRALPHIKRLQEMEKAFLMATHKAVDPPLNIPARMRGKINSLPGGQNFYTNPSEVVSELYQGRFEYQGVTMNIERVEQRIQRVFYNDIFLTASRDPNASPYKATEVMAREQEKMLRLGPVIERLQFEFLQPLVERCFNIMVRKELFPPLSPELAQLASDYQIHIVSPLATAQRAVALQGINSFMAFIGQAAQFDQTILDNIDVDEAAREHATISGVRLGILRTKEAVQTIRQQRQQMQQAEMARQQQLEEAQVGGQVNLQQASAQKAQAEAGVTLIEGQQMAQQAGLI